MKTNTIKKFIVLLFVSILASILCFTCNSFANEKSNNDSVYDSQCCIDGITYNLTSYNHEASIKGYNRSISGTIIIPEIITFQDEEYIVKSIGPQAFSFCPNPIVVVPDSITSIGVEAFAKSFCLKDIYFCGNQPAISFLAFQDMTFALHCPLEGTNWNPNAHHLGDAKMIYYNNRNTKFELEGQCYDCGLKLPIKNNEIEILDENDKVISIVYSNENGDYYFRLFKDRPISTHSIKIRTTYQGKTKTSKEASTECDKAFLNIVFN